MLIVNGNTFADMSCRIATEDEVKIVLQNHYYIRKQYLDKAFNTLAQNRYTVLFENRHIYLGGKYAPDGLLLIKSRPSALAEAYKELGETPVLIEAIAMNLKIKEVDSFVIHYKHIDLVDFPASFNAAVRKIRLDEILENI